jgi:hypothetical protein
MFLLNGKHLPEGVPFEIDGIQYPSNWLNLSTPEEKAAIGITEVEQQPRPDDNLYWVSDNGDGTWTAIPRSPEDIAARTKAAVINQIATLENSNPVTQRAIRELMLAIGQAYPQAQASVFYQKALQQEAAIQQLRSQL